MATPSAERREMVAILAAPEAANALPLTEAVVPENPTDVGMGETEVVNPGDQIGT